MIRTRFLCLALCGAVAVGVAGAARAAEVDCDSVYCFSAKDFSQEELAGVCVTGLPESGTGTVMLGNRVIRSGDILTAQQLSMLTFQPLLTEQDCQATVTYLPIFSDRVEGATEMTISIKGKVDKAPVAEDSAIETYKNLPNQGKLKVTDPEGQKLTYTVTRQPKRGTVTVSEDGTYLYTPKKNKVGTDSFTFTATDPAGKVSREATVTVQILKPTTKEQYTDTVGQSCRFTAEWMKETGLFVGEQVAGQLCFQPQKTVSRGEFLTVLVKALQIPVDEDAVHTGFSDEAPGWLRPYLAAALRTGISAGWPYGDSFQAQEPITGAEAALLLQNALDLEVSVIASGKENDGELPVWAENAIGAMAEHGVDVSAEVLTRAQAAQLLYQAMGIADETLGM
ncbi:MAG: S-layer homology domain-containing protein [Oscillospiraceae bacterium]|nr:S-layer homology domain-containing protein [Oscillospiraceae bacterium]